MGIDELLREKREDILQIAAKHGAYQVRIFGSVAWGEAKADSDKEWEHLAPLCERSGQDARTTNLQKRDAPQSGRDAFMQTRMIQDAVIRKFEVIGEATKRISEELKLAYPDVSWREMAEFRDVLIHNYINVNLTVVWNIIERDLPQLKRKIEAILQELAEDMRQRKEPVTFIYAHLLNTKAHGFGRR